MHSLIVLARECHWIQVCGRRMYAFCMHSNSIAQFFSVNWTDTNVADVDAIVILENVKQLNFVNENRHIGFDSQATFLILSVSSTFRLTI